MNRDNSSQIRRSIWRWHAYAWLVSLALLLLFTFRPTGWQSTGTWFVMAGHGQAIWGKVPIGSFRHSRTRSLGPLVVSEDPGEIRWWFTLNTRVGGTGWYFGFPLWPIVLAWLAWIMWYRHRATQRLLASNDCSKCGYDRTGLSRGAPCPECGLLYSQPNLITHTKHRE